MASADDLDGVSEKRRRLSGEDQRMGSRAPSPSDLALAGFLCPSGTGLGEAWAPLRGRAAAAGQVPNPLSLLCLCISSRHDNSPPCSGRAPVVVSGESRPPQGS
jgi:hypothetical protein